MKRMRRIALLVTLGLLASFMIVNVLLPTDEMTELLFGGGSALAPNRALKVAVQMNDLAGVKRAIANGAQLGALDADGWSPLSRAVATGDLAICETLMAQGADPDGGGMTETIPPIVCAAVYQRREVMDLLIRHGANVNGRTRGGGTALNLAASMGHAEMAVALIRVGADVNAADDHGWTPLMGAATQPEAASLIDDLLIAGAQADATDNEGQTAMNIAAAGDNRRAIELLLRRRRQESFGRTLLGMTPPADADVSTRDTRG